SPQCFSQSLQFEGSRIASDPIVNAAISARPFTFTECEARSPEPARRGGSEARDRRQWPRLGGALLLEQVGQQEGKIERLLGIEPRIADGVIAVVEILVRDG